MFLVAADGEIPKRIKDAFKALSENRYALGAVMEKMIHHPDRHHDVFFQKAAVLSQPVVCLAKWNTEPGAIDMFFPQPGPTEYVAATASSAAAFLFMSDFRDIAVVLLGDDGCGFVFRSEGVETLWRELDAAKTKEMQGGGAKRGDNENRN